MYKILLAEDLAPNIHKFKIDAPTIARKAEPGQFVIVRVDMKRVNESLSPSLTGIEMKGVLLSSSTRVGRDYQ